MMVRITIDKQIVHVRRHTPILDAATQLGISIPTLCDHEALKPYGSCRLCLVEVRINTGPKLVTSCNYPAEDGMVVFTSTERVRKTRQMIVELLLARCPDVPQIQHLAEQMGITDVRLKKKGEEHCILCGLCVRACEEMVGVSAIGFTSRGTEKTIDTPFSLDSDVCIGCGTCTYICPTGCIEMVGEPGPPGGRRMRMGSLNLEPCPNEHACETCELDQQFMEEMKQIVQEVRGEA